MFSRGILGQSLVKSPSTGENALLSLLGLPPALRTFATSSIYRDQQDDKILREALRGQTESNGSVPMVPRPSSSVLLISPNNQVLLLQRVKQSSSFPSAHVFPGGNVSTFHDGDPPPPETAERHVDNEVYRLAAIRETFEESGILLARNNGFGRLIEVPEAEREEGRRLVHGSKVPFTKWLAQKGGRADVDGLTPFTRWVTPTNVPKRFTTQMYLYFLPTLSSTPLSEAARDDSEAEVQIPVPTTDGGLEHTNARFLPASVWLRLAQEGRIILFPPQFFLLHQIAQHFDNLPSPTAYGSISREPLPREELEARRRRLLEFVNSGQPPWMEMCISPSAEPPRDGKRREDGRAVLGLHRPGPELEALKAGRGGPRDQCVLVEFKKEGPRRLAVISREEALGPSSRL
ncbi:NUDIX domain [Teratosphaeria destructans]|uniref:NUDIX domain n=1 Tax=Teratosphaeria destructans TaxID=418781 RepID=A0A9W7W4W8_9PEZI|nr:NUDIX domain [Teratosphaeria destructans]